MSAKKWKQIRQEHLIIFKKLSDEEKLDILRDGSNELKIDHLIDLKLHIHGILLARAKDIREFDGIMEASYGKDSEG